jgi:hypothetical protein
MSLDSAAPLSVEQPTDIVGPLGAITMEPLPKGSADMVDGTVLISGPLDDLDVPTLREGLNCCRTNLLSGTTATADLVKFSHQALPKEQDGSWLATMVRQPA